MDWKLQTETGAILIKQYESFQNVFQSDNYYDPYCKFKHFREISKPIQYLSKKYPTKNVEFLEIFSYENWDNLKKKKN